MAKMQSRQRWLCLRARFKFNYLASKLIGLCAVHLPNSSPNLHFGAFWLLLVITQWLLRLFFGNYPVSLIFLNYRDASITIHAPICHSTIAPDKISNLFISLGHHFEATWRVLNRDSLDALFVTVLLPFDWGNSFKAVYCPIYHISSSYFIPFRSLLAYHVHRRWRSFRKIDEHGFIVVLIYSIQFRTLFTWNTLYL